MMSKTDMRAMMFDVMADALDHAAASLRLTEAMGPGAKQKDVDRMQVYYRSEAGKLRAKKTIFLNGIRLRKMRRMEAETDET